MIAPLPVWFGLGRLHARQYQRAYSPPLSLSLMHVLYYRVGYVIGLVAHAVKGPDPINRRGYGNDNSANPE
jgi:hypothetical protein